MKGLNYQFQCHHPFSAMHALALDYSNFLTQKRYMDRNRLHCNSRSSSPADLVAEELLERASAVVQRALIFSDISFLFPPGQVGFAAVAIALGSATGDDGYIGDNLMLYLKNRFARKTQEELDNFVQTVGCVIQTLYKCPLMDLAATESRKYVCQVMAERAEDMKRVLGKVANIRYRMLRQSSCYGSTWQPRKRSRLELEFTPPRKKLLRSSARVTPVGQH
jgi:hypothetical protein